MALSCRRDEDGFTSAEDLAQRAQWLQQDVAMKKEAWQTSLLQELKRKMNSSELPLPMAAVFERSWRMYAEDLGQALWRTASGHPAEFEAQQDESRSTLNPLDDDLKQASNTAGNMWQVFPTYVMTKPLSSMFKWRGNGRGRVSASVLAAERDDSCFACGELTHIVLEKYREFELNVQAQREGGSPSSADLHSADVAANGDSTASSEGGRRPHMRPDAVNNAFFAWQLTHESEQEEQGGAVWPELYRDSEAFVELKNLAKLACLEYLQKVYDASLDESDLAQLELSIWASVTPPRAEDDLSADAMGLAFHDHPLALLSGVFYAQTGGETVGEKTPTVFADPRGTPTFRYTRPEQRVAQPSQGGSGSSTERSGNDAGTARHGHARGRGASDGLKGRTEDSMEPVAPFHRLAYAHASEGHALVFPSWLVHGVPPHRGRSARVSFAFNLHTLHGTTLSSWTKTTL